MKIIYQCFINIINIFISVGVDPVMLSQEMMQTDDLHVENMVRFSDFGAILLYIKFKLISLLML